MTPAGQTVRISEPGLERGAEGGTGEKVLVRAVEVVFEES